LNPIVLGGLMSRLILTLNNKVLSIHLIAPGEELSIGRKPDNQIIIDHQAVSSYHAQLRLDGSKLIIKDLNSQNGTYVNDEKITEFQLGHQDWITVGKHIFIVDLYRSLSIEVTENELRARSQADSEANQTLALSRDDVLTGHMSFYYLSFLNSTREDFDLNHQLVSVGKNKDAAIKIPGMWSFFAGAPSATIAKINDMFIVKHLAGMLKTKVNGNTIQGTTKLNHQDVIKIGPLEMEFRCVQRPLH
jgi:pSer/pThr/pTyr-binding forkhead associated (FHA) protein